MGERVFARRLHKRDAGVYITLRCELEPERVAGLRDRLKLVDNLFRLQILVADLRPVEAAAAVPAGELKADA
jgi:ribosomal protein S6